MHGIDATEADILVAGSADGMRHHVFGALEALTAGVNVSCQSRADRRGRLVLELFSCKGVDIGRWSVSAGWFDALEGARLGRRFS